MAVVSVCHKPRCPIETAKQIDLDFGTDAIPYPTLWLCCMKFMYLQKGTSL